jgi:hypothetical protein
MSADHFVQIRCRIAAQERRQVRQRQHRPETLAQEARPTLAQHDLLTCLRLRMPGPLKLCVLDDDLLGALHSQTLTAAVPDLAFVRFPLFAPDRQFQVSRCGPGKVLLDGGLEIGRMAGDQDPGQPQRGDQAGGRKCRREPGTARRAQKPVGSPGNWLGGRPDARHDALGD